MAVTAPPCGPVLGITDDGAGDGDPTAAAALIGVVASAPSRTSTCPAATDELAVAVTPNRPAILVALAETPGPYPIAVAVR